MNTPPRLFVSRFRQHNRQCWLSALGALLLAWLGWVFFYGIFVALVLLFETIRFGEGATWPTWLNPAVGVIIVVLLVLAAIRQRWRKYRPVRDRSIIGWHLVGQVLLMPAGWTLDAAAYLDARLKLSKYELSEALRLLQVICHLERASVQSLTYYFSDAVLLRKLLIALQTIGWIDLHRGENEWYYLPVSTMRDEIEAFFRDDSASRSALD